MFDTLRLAIASYRIFRDFNRLDQVLAAATRMATPAQLDAAAEVIAASSPAAARAIAERRRLEVDLDRLARCPAGSLGRAVFDHCDAYGIHPSAFPTRPNNSPGQFLLVHIENTHDIWHPVTGFGSDAVGEMGLQAFYLALLPNRLGLLLLGLAFLHAFVHAPQGYVPLVDAIARGWVLGKRASCLFGVDWEALYDQPLATVRRSLQLDVTGVADATAPGTPEVLRRVRGVPSAPEGELPNWPVAIVGAPAPAPRRRRRPRTIPSLDVARARLAPSPRRFGPS